MIQRIVSTTTKVEGRRFYEQTITGKIKSGRATITTVFMNDKPILKKYVLEKTNLIKRLWKTLNSKHEYYTEEKLNVLV